MKDYFGKNQLVFFKKYKFIQVAKCIIPLPINTRFKYAFFQLSKTHDFYP